mmetsp:Transcript_128456/g.371723  ORF Transcript_128456/g.371723 Transcript_128456/m.371723 type:complete len:275 (+) Transcript_128456:88-912(+)
MLQQYAWLSCLLLLASIGCDAFAPHPRPSVPVTTTSWSDGGVKATATSLFAVQRLSAAQKSRRRELLSRNGPYFKLNRFQGAVEFGSTATLTTKLDTQPNPEGIAEWLQDGRGLALSIWDEKMMKDMGNSLYQLQTMKLQFVTITLSPTVDVQMSTEMDSSGQPVFSLQSVGFDPNIQLLPGVGVSASSLGIHIDVVGELRPSKDGTGVSGVISFATTGNLPPPMRVLPEPALKMASDTINETIVSFAVKSFQQGAIQKYKEYQASKQGQTQTR